MSVPNPMKTSKMIEDAMQQAASLAGERAFRGTGLHPEGDARIATEIAATLFHLGWRAKILRDENERFRESIKINCERLTGIAQAEALLQTELDIANHKDRTPLL